MHEDTIGLVLVSLCGHMRTFLVGLARGILGLSGLYLLLRLLSHYQLILTSSKIISAKGPY